MRSYRPAELFDANGAPRPQILELVPKGTRRMGSNPHTNGGLLLADLPLPPIADYAVNVPAPGKKTAESTRVLGQWLRDLFKNTAGHPVISVSSARTRPARTDSMRCSK